jgi:Domain of unknown function (DUF4442)
MMATLTATPSVLKLNDAQNERLNDFNSAFKLWFWLLFKLPAAWFMGVRVRYVTPEKTAITLPYGWRSQNPFNSIYFAAQAAAAEFSTGAMATLAIAGRGRVSMLVSNLEMTFTKKATSLTTFTCEDGAAVFEIVEKAVKTKEPQTITMTSIGTQANGEIVSTMKITWSFKAK